MALKLEAARASEPTDVLAGSNSEEPNQVARPLQEPAQSEGEVEESGNEAEATSNMLQQPEDSITATEVDVSGGPNKQPAKLIPTKKFKEDLVKVRFLTKIDLS